MAMHAYKSMAHDDMDRYDLEKGMPDGYEAPDYPSGLCISMTKADLERASSGGGDIGDTLHFSAMGDVTSIYRDADGCRIELQLGEFAGEDGKFFDLEEPCYLCLGRPQLEKMDLGEDCERGDMIHLVGLARLESHSDTEYGGARCTLQVTDLSYAEDESAESRAA